MARFEIRSAPQFHIFSSKMARFEIRSAPQFHEFSSEIVSFQIRSAPQFHQFSVENCSFSNKEFRQKWSNFKEGARGAVSCRAGPGRVADSLFRPHPEQRARASREAKRTHAQCGEKRKCELQIGSRRKNLWQTCLSTTCSRARDSCSVSTLRLPMQTPLTEMSIPAQGKYSSEPL